MDNALLFMSLTIAQSARTLTKSGESKNLQNNYNYPFAIYQ